MEKGWKCICIVGGVVALCAGASFVKDYHNMRRTEKNLDSLPLHKFKGKLSGIQKDREKIVLTIPRDMPMLKRLRVCGHVLHGNVGSRDACKW